MSPSLARGRLRFDTFGPQRYPHQVLIPLPLVDLCSNLSAMEISVSRPPITPHYVEYNKHLDQTIIISQRLVSPSLVPYPPPPLLR